MSPRPLAIDLFCGLGGWTEGFLAEGYDVIGFDIERRPYPAQLVLQDVLTLDGAQFRHAAVIVASPPCQAYSYRAMPWKRAKALPPPSNELFDACFRIQREAIAATGHPCSACDRVLVRAIPGHKCPRCNGTCWLTRQIPMVVENVKGAQPWVGSAKWHYGSYYLWGNVPALMPFSNGHRKQEGDPSWFYDNYAGSARRYSSHSKERKAWSAQIAKIPFPLAEYIARCFKP